MGLAIIVPIVSFNDANLGKVTLSGNVPIRGLYINLEDSYTDELVALKCSYLPANTTQRDVVWSIKEGSEYASVSGNVLTILSGASNNDVVVKCTSSSNPNVTAEKTIKVTYNSGDAPIYDEEKTVASSSGIGISTGITPFDGNPYTIIIKTKNYQVDNLKAIISCYYQTSPTLSGFSVSTWQNVLYIQYDYNGEFDVPQNGLYEDSDDYFTAVLILNNNVATIYYNKGEHYSRSYDINMRELYFGWDGQRQGMSTGSSESRITVYSGVRTDILDVVFN